jgi:hypothetical protein
MRKRGSWAPLARALGLSRLEAKPTPAKAESCWSRARRLRIGGLRTIVKERGKKKGIGDRASAAAQ